ncbi:nucleotidyltransferase family protein [Hellea balneolensis]|uniref:nucleotidyltransferase family protein n=1 Tax=Hellea balneolensis TaxID=287478 RepID=UPI00042819A9|nr:nucleotidyltransferase family protein [Hellea balneolensis]
MIKTAMVMAAGHGTRMRPLTNDRSKAMVEVGGKPLIEHMLDRLEEVDVERAVVNVHAHADHLEAHLKSRKPGLEIIISDEREALLETGGGVVKALPLLGISPVFICNIDAIWQPFEPVLERLIEAWEPGVMDELLLCARADWALGYAGKGDFNIHSDARLTRRDGDSADHVYAGVQIFKPDLAKPFKEERFSRNKIWDETLKRQKLFGVELPGYWMHVGDPRAVMAAEAVLKEAHG